MSTELRLRILSTLVILPLILGVMYAGSYYFVAFLMLLSVAMGEEWRRLSAVSTRLSSVIMGVGIGGVLLGIYKEEPTLSAFFLIAGPACLLLQTRLYEQEKKDGHSISLMVIGFFYLCVGMIAALFIRLNGIGLDLGLWILSMVIATDIGGFVVGRKFKGPKLAPRLSPGKTWSGLMGGMGFAAVVSVVITQYKVDHTLVVPIYEAVVIGLIVALCAQMGDLAESGLKRRVGLKDSSRLIPGHGGVLDRMDGFLAALPVFYGLIWLLDHV